MNIGLGLERISAVWWGFLGLLAGISLLAPFWKGFDGELFGMGVAGLIGSYLGHRLTCWVISGFFAVRS